MTTTPSAEFTLDLTRGNVKEAMKGISSGDLYNCPYEKIHIIPGFNGRVETPEYQAHVDRLEASITNNGFYKAKPLAGYVAVVDGEQIIYLTEGYSRHRAVGQAIGKGVPIKTVPLIIVDRTTSMEDLTYEQVNSNIHQANSPLEIGILAKRLIGYGETEATVARKFGIGTRYLDDLLMLVAAPRQVRDLVATGKVSPTLAIEELKKDAPKAKTRLVEGVKSAEAKGKTKATKKDLPTTSVATARNKPPKASKAVKVDTPTSITRRAILEAGEDAGFAPRSSLDTAQKLIAFARRLGLIVEDLPIAPAVPGEEGL